MLLYFKANDVTTAEQVPVLLTTISSETYTLLCSLASLAKPYDMTFWELSTILYFQP